MADRTPEERERARLERAAKRAQREGRPPPTELPSTEVPPPAGAEPVYEEPVRDETARPEPVPAATPEPPAAEPEPQPPAEEPAFARDDFMTEPAPAPAPAPPAPEAEPLPETADLPAVDAEPEPELFYDPVEDEPQPPPVDAEPPSAAMEEPAPVVEEHAAFEEEPPFDDEGPLEEEPPFEDEGPLEEEPLPAAAAPTRTVPDLPRYPPTAPVTRVRPAPAAPVIAPPGAPAGARSRHRGARRAALGVLVVLVLAVVWFAWSLFQPFKGDGSGRTVVQIPTGASVGEIADQLSRRGVVSSAFFFEARATLAGRRDEFKAGRFTLAQGMSNAAAMDAISKGPPPDVTQVVIPEGRARTQVRDIIGKRLRGNYLTLTRRSSTLDPRRYGAPRNVSSLEGFLFPDTYELKKDATTRTLVDQQLAQFKREFGTVDLRASKRRKLTPYDVLIIASMIDQEVQVPRERRIVASVIVNRLREGIPLGIDATIRYATNNRTRPLTQSQLAIDSPYNTRTRRGLPPGPIASPGLAAIRAAANPARTNYLFYVVKPGGNGSHAFSATDAQFQRDVQRYNSARARRGGKSPSKR